jgi:hypothetical protein
MSDSHTLHTALLGEFMAFETIRIILFLCHGTFDLALGPA